MKHINVAIDGPSGAGKSTIARAAAKDLGLLYVDTGAIYRSIGYYLLRHGVDPKDKDRVVPLLPGIRIALRYEDDGLQHMLLNGQDVTAEIRFPEVSVNSTGEVIGISQSIYNPDHNISNIGIGFAIPSNEAIKFIATVKK